MKGKGQMKKDIIAGIDIGSSNIKTVLFNKDLEIEANESREINILFPRPGWTEYNPDDWWKYVKETLRDCLLKTNISPERIAGVGLSSLGCCAVPLDKNGDHVYNAIPWSDQRAEKEVEFLVNNCKEQIFSACGNIPTGLSATPHLMWIKNSEPEVYRRIYKYTEASGYLGRKLTGNFVLDHSMASGLDYGFDVNTLDYNRELIKSMGLDRDKFPSLYKNTESIGNVTEEAAKETGLISGTPVYMGGLDILSAAVAGGAIQPGQGFYSMGSASNMMIITDKKVSTPYMTSILHIISPGIRCLFGSQGSVGYSLKWFRDQLGQPEQRAAAVLDDRVNAFEIMTSEAMKTEPGAGGVIYLPYLFGKFHPVFNQHAQGVFFGVTPTTTKSKIIRAIMEGCTYNMYETIKSARDIGIELSEIITSGGPSKSGLWCRIIADVTNCRVITIESPEASPMGNAILAGVGNGLFDGFKQAADKYIKKENEYVPDKKNHQLYEEIFDIYNEVYNSVAPSFSRMVKLKEKMNMN
jgi:xylulokinase